ncbi:MAG: acyltransferase [Bacteroides sp.]|nr:acyltransferase [Bacteroides sp.]
MFFYKTNFTRPVYYQKLRKRMWTLLVPYLFWNILCLVFYYMAFRLPILSAWFQGADYNFNYILSALWGKMDEQSNMTYPIAYQFWFIRDLMVCVVISPLLFRFVTKTRYYGVILLGICWYLGYYLPYIGLRGFSTIAIFFFTFGAWFSIHCKNVLDIFRKLKYWPFLYIPVAILDLCTKREIYNLYIHHAGILLGIIVCFTGTAYLLEKGKIHIIPFLSSASFFVFAVHDPWLLMQIRKILFKLIRPESDMVLTLLYFGVVVLVIAIALGTYYLLRRYLPRFTAFITGGR